MAAGDGRGLVYHLNRKGGTLAADRPTLEAAGAANAYAGTSGLDVVGALNAAAGNTLAPAFLAPPVLTLGATTLGGTFAAGNYFWKVTAHNVSGETTGSNEVTATLLLNQQQALSWTAVPHATSYSVYRGTAAGAENVRVTTTTATSYTDTGTAGTAATVPTVNTAATLRPLELAGVLNQLAGTTGFEVDEAAARIA